jgi:hypothetical protein
MEKTRDAYTILVENDYLEYQKRDERIILN